MCDFCCHLLGDDVTTWLTDSPMVEEILIAKPGDAAAGSGVAAVFNDEEWACCPDCDPVVAAGDPARLANHVADRADYARIGSPRAADDVRRLTEFYVGFYARNPKRQEVAT